MRALKAGGLDVQSERVETEAELKRALETKNWDFILSDYHLPAFDGPRALQVYKESGLDIPFIIVSELIGKEQSVKLIKVVRTGYLLSSRPAARMNAQQMLKAD